MADIILHHHERIDGEGYPRGIAGDAIPELARIVSIVDTFDVMTSRDSYRAPVSPQVAIAELRRVSGTQLDPRLLEIFIGLIEREGLDFGHADNADLELELSAERLPGSGRLSGR